MGGGFWQTTEATETKMTAYKILFTPHAQKDINHLPLPIKERVEQVLHKISINPYLGKTLQGEWKGAYSYRLSDYRIIYKINKSSILVIVLKIGHRKDIYRGN